MQKQLFVEPIPETWTPDQKLMALSWKQPYAELMLHGKIETRTWATKYRGWVLICASKQGYSFAELLTISGRDRYEKMPLIIDDPNRFDYKGMAIAIARLSDCRPMTPADEDAAFVQYRPGLWCHIYTDVCAITPLPWKGTQGWKEVSEYIKAQIKIQ